MKMEKSIDEIVGDIIPYMSAANNFDSIIFQKRDFALFRDLFESRAMTGAHIATLHFDGNKETAKKRLQKLKAAGYLSERPRQVTEPAVLFLTRKAFGILREQGVLHEYPSFTMTDLEKRARVSDLTIRHELAVLDVKAAFHATLRKNETFSVAEFNTWPLLHQFQAARSGNSASVLVKPDGFIRFHEKEAGGGLFEHAFFLEVDRSSESLDTLVGKAACYVNYYKSGGFALRNGAAREAFKEYPFRVLITVPTAKRRNDLAGLLLQNNPPIFTQVLLATFKDMTANALGAVWMTPAAYRDALKGTLFDTERFPQARTYRKETERDFFVEKNVEKLTLLS